MTVDGRRYDLTTFISGKPMTYATATCGCVGGFCAPGGACSCVERGGETCSVCTTGHSLGSHAQTVGVGSLAAHVRICEEDAETIPPTPAPPRTTAAPGTGPQGTPVPSSPKTPAPRPITPATPAPTVSTDHTEAPDTQNAQQPPLRTLRYVLAYGALFVVVAYSMSFVFKYRKRARNTLLSHNPFHRSGGSGGSSDSSSRHRFGAIQDEDEDDDDAYNLPVRTT